MVREEKKRGIIELSVKKEYHNLLTSMREISNPLSLLVSFIIKDRLEL